MRGLLGHIGTDGDRLRLRRLRLSWLLAAALSIPGSHHGDRVDEFVHQLALCGAPPEERAN